MNDPNRGSRRDSNTRLSTTRYISLSDRPRTSARRNFRDHVSLLGSISASAANLSRDELISRLRIRADVLTLSSDGKRITVRMKDFPRVVVQSETDFVPEGMNARVFVRYVKEKRSGSLNSVHLQETSNEKRLLERLKK